MLQDYKSKCVRVWDYSLFTAFAQKLSTWFGRVEYTSDWKGEFPHDRDRRIGKGVPGLHRIDDAFEGLDNVDLHFFPDCLEGDLQLYLEKNGARVFGSRMGEDIELFRTWSKQEFKKLGIPVGPYAEVKGTDGLRKYLKEHKNQWIKMDMCRGTMETWFSSSLELSEQRICQLESDLGGAKNQVKFVCEEPIQCDVERGFDGYTVDGIFPSKCLVGIEAKDKAYFGIVAPYDTLPEQVRSINEKLKPLLKKCRYRNFFSTEERNGCFTDACARLGSPPNEVYQNLITNIPDIMWYGAEGQFIEPEFSATYAGHVFISSSWAELGKWQSIKYPEKYKDNIKLRKWTRIDGIDYVVPKGEHAEFLGAIVETGDDRDKIKDKIKEIADTIKGHGIKICCDDLDCAEDGLKKMMTQMKDQK